MNNKYLLIPLDLIQFVLTTKLSKAFKTFLYLKFTYGGYVNFTEDAKIILQELDIKHKVTLISHLKKLHKLNWIGFEDKYEKVYIRSFKYIGVDMDFFSSRNAILESYHFIDFKGFLAAAFITKLILSQKGKIFRGNKNGVGNRSRKKARVLQRNSTPSFKISTIVIANILECSLSTAHKIKICAAKNKLVLKQKKMTKIARLHSKLLYEYANSVDCHPGRFRTKDFEVYKCDIDQFSIGSLGTKRSRHNISKKNETYIKHYRDRNI